MNRKDFLAAGGSLLAAGSLSFLPPGNDPDDRPVLPAYLRRGDLIGITAPAGFLLVPDIAPTIRRLEAWGFRVKLGTSIGKRSGSLAGTDEERLADLQRMLDDPMVRAVFCARGGYGSVRIVERVDWSAFKKNPKWVIGFSDITVLHSHLNRKLGIGSIHSKMSGAFPAEASAIDQLSLDTAESIRKALMGEPVSYPVKPHERNRAGSGQGVLVGGNLKTLESLSGTGSDLRTDGKILFLEDVGEQLYSIDRMFWNLEQSGKLRKLAGLILGGFRIKPADSPDEEFGLDLYAIVWEKISRYNYPVCFEFPVGHQKNNYALTCGALHRLTVDSSSVSLTEIK